MLHKLETGQYPAVQALAQKMPIHLAIESVLKGKSPGFVITDDPVRPTAAFISTGDRCFLLGSHGNLSFNEELSVYLQERLLPEAARSGDGLFVLYYAPPKRKNEIKALFGRMEPIFKNRHYLSIELSQLPMECPLPTGYSLHPVDYSMIENPDLEHVGLLIEEILSEAPTVKHFLDNCFGICVQYKDILVGWCLSEYNLDLKCEVGIETLRPYQRQGVGSAMAGALIREAEIRGYKQVGWHSYENNQASSATAHKAGFVKAAEYPVCILELPKPSHNHSQGPLGDEAVSN
jgi:GNAT superfamily N-acetyltransferase